MFDTYAPQAASIAQLMIVIMAICGVIWLLLVIVLLAALWRRRPSRRLEPLALDRRVQRRMQTVVTICVAATVLIVTFFTLASFASTRQLAAPGDDAVVILLRGYQWWWEATYLDADPDRVFTTANELHVPVAKPIRIELEAADVVHSFWVPSLNGKQDLIPGRKNEISFTAERPGIYRGQCAEFCGLQHARMAVLVTAQEPEEFERWRDGQREAAASPADEAQETGQRVFMAKACSACHTVRGTPATGKLGPDLTHVGSRRTIAAGVLDTTRGSLAAWIADPQTIKPGNNMPRVPLSPDELQAVSAYMASLK